MAIPSIDKRALKIKALAYGKGWAYKAGNDWQLMKDLEDFDLMQKGLEHEISNVIEANIEDTSSKLMVFDYKYQFDRLEWDMEDMEVEEGTEYHCQTVFYVSSNSMDLPDMDIRPEGLWDKVKQFFGWDDVDFNKNKRFSKMYSVTADDKEKLKQVVSERFMDLLDDEKTWWIEGKGDDLIVFRDNQLVEVKDLEDFLNFGISLFESLK